MKRLVRRSTIDGTIAAPPSKSVAVRVTAAALLAGGETATLLNPSHCDDARSALRVIRALGAEVDSSPDALRITGGLAARERVLDCGESGLCLRMFTAISALLDEEFTITGREPLLRRPATAVECPSEMLGATCTTDHGHPPVVVRGPFRGGRAVVDGHLSSQFLSGLLLALPSVDADSTLVVTNLTSRPYIDLTLRLLERFGVRVEREGYREFFIPGGQRISVGEHRIEGDWSAAAFLLVLGAIGGRIRVTGLDPESVQADRRVIDVIEAAGATVIHHADGAEVESDALRGFEFDVADAPDLLPPLAALACSCDGDSVFHGVDRLRHKECDRTEAIATELVKLGIAVTVEEDRMTIRGGPVSGGSTEAHGDHRIAMALATAGVISNGPVEIEGTEHVAKSYPEFFADLAATGGRVA